jgi:tRNA/tmRNA/rRNA uracil-C5-methylase (TrmA/RlmC/RlmD family)
VPEHQRELKRRVLVDALGRMAGLAPEVTVEPRPGSGDGTGWRTRVRLHADENGVLGPYAARSHRVVPVADLPLAAPEVAAAAPLGARAAGAVRIVGPSTGPVVVLAGDERGEPIGETIVERVGEREFRLDAGGFWQVHRRAAETLTAAVQEAIDPALLDPAAANLDLYGGVGLLAAAVGDRFGSGIRIASVESDASATRHAGENLADLRGASVVTARVDRYLARLRSERARLDGATVVLDPPRSGAGKDVVAALAALGPAQLVYVACDPVALARDLALFAARGYRLTGIRAFDLFPNTHHVEAVASLTKD